MRREYDEYHDVQAEYCRAQAGHQTCVQAPPVTYIGPGKAEETGRLLKMLGARKTLVITDGFLHQSGLLNGLLDSIRRAEVEYTVFDGVQSDPTFAIVASAKQACTGCDTVVAVGGRIGDGHRQIGGCGDGQPD